MLKDEFCTTQGSACIIFMGADFWAARIYEGWGRGNAKTGCGASNKRGAASLLLPPPSYNKNADYPGPLQANREGRRNGAAGCDFFFLPKPLYIRHIQRRVKNI